MQESLNLTAVFRGRRAGTAKLAGLENIAAGSSEGVIW